MKRVISITAIAFALVTLATGCTSADAIMTGNSHPPTDPSQVRVFLRQPASFDSIGLITATSNSTPIRSKNKTRALNELREKAAELGANGIILTQDNGSTATVGTVILPAGSNTGFMTSGRGTEVEVQGEAIWVKGE
ncbi:MAG: hypothetical protein ACOH1V_07905 [Stenotrophomonas sp.]